MDRPFMRCLRSWGREVQEIQAEVKKSPQEEFGGRRREICLKMFISDLSPPFAVSVCAQGQEETPHEYFITRHFSDMLPHGC